MLLGFYCVLFMFCRDDIIQAKKKSKTNTNLFFHSFKGMDVLLVILKVKVNFLFSINISSTYQIFLYINENFMQSLHFPSGSAVCQTVLASVFIWLLFSGPLSLPNLPSPASGATICHLSPAFFFCLSPERYPFLYIYCFSFEGYLFGILFHEGITE